MQEEKTNKTFFRSLFYGVSFIVVGIIVIFISYRVKSILCSAGNELYCTVPTLAIVIASFAIIIGLATAILSFIDRNKKTSTPMFKSKNENGNRKVKFTTLLFVFGMIILIFGLALFEIIIR
jgi:hypothetical protein